MVVKKDGNKRNYFNGDLEYFEGRNLEMGKIIFKNSEDLYVNTNIDILITTTNSFTFHFLLNFN